MFSNSSLMRNALVSSDRFFNAGRFFATPYAQLHIGNKSQLRNAITPQQLQQAINPHKTIHTKNIASEKVQATLANLRKILSRPSVPLHSMSKIKYCLTHVLTLCKGAFNSTSFVPHHTTAPSSETSDSPSDGDERPKRLICTIILHLTTLFLCITHTASATSSLEAAK